MKKILIQLARSLLCILFKHTEYNSFISDSALSSHVETTQNFL